MEIAMVKIADSKYYLHSFAIGLLCRPIALLISVYTRWRHYAGRLIRYIFLMPGADDVNFNIA